MGQIQKQWTEMGVWRDREVICMGYTAGAHRRKSNKADICSECAALIFSFRKNLKDNVISLFGIWHFIQIRRFHFNAIWLWLSYYISY